MTTSKSRELESVVSRYYEDALEIRSRILRDNPEISQDEYSLELWKVLIPYFNKMLNHLSSKICEGDLEYLSGRMREVNHAVLSMVVRGN